MNAEAAILKARLVEIRRRLENLLRDKLQFMHLFLLWDHLERGGWDEKKRNFEIISFLPRSKANADIIKYWQPEEIHMKH